MVIGRNTYRVLGKSSIDDERPDGGFVLSDSIRR